MTTRGGAVLKDVQTLFRAGAIGGLGDGQLLAMFASRPGEAAEAAFAALVERHGPMVLRACRGILRDEHAAQDAFQATFLILARKAGRIWVRDSLGPWLYGVACRVAGDARKAETRRRALERQAIGVSAARTAPGIEDDGGELRAVMHEEIGRLSPSHRAAVVLCDLEGRTHEEAARLIGCPAGTVKSRQARARERLRVRLARRGLAPSAGLFTAALASRAGASVPGPLASATVRAAIRFAFGRVASAGALSTAVAAAAVRASRGLALARLRVIAPALLAVATAAGAVAYRAGLGAASLDPGPPDRGPGQAAAPAVPISPPVPRLDLYGDSLPPGARLRLGTQRSRQKSEVSGIAYAPDGKALVTGVEGGGLQVWDPQTGKPLRRIDAGIESLRDFAFRRDGKVLAAVGFTFDAERRQVLRVLSLSDFAGGQRLRRIEWEDNAEIRCLAFAPDGTSIATGSGDGILRLWDVESEDELLKLKLGQVDVQAVAFSPDASTLAACSRDGSGNNNLIHLIDLDRGLETRALAGHERPIRTMTFSPDGKILASGAEEEVVILWDVASGRELRRLDGGNSFHGTVAFSPDGTSVAASGGDGIVTIWEVATGRRRRRIESTRSWYGLMAFSPDGKTIASNSGPVLHLWDVETGRDRIEMAEAHELDVTRLLCADGGRTLITGSDDGTARVWDLATGRQRAVLKHEGSVRALALSPDGRFLATGAHQADSGVHLWELATGRELRSWPGRGHLEAAVAVAFTPEGNDLLSAWSDGSVRRYETATGHEVPTIQPAISYPEREFGESNVAGGAFSLGGGILVVNGPSRGIHVAEMGTGRELFKTAGNSFALSSDGKTLAVAVHVSGRIKLSDGRTRFSTDLGEGVIRLFDVATGEERHKISQPSASFFGLAFTPDGRALAAAQGGKTNVIRVYRTTDGRELTTLRGHDASTRSLGFTPDGRGLASGLEDTSVLIWDVPSPP